MTVALLERDEVLATLRALEVSAREGAGRVALVTGEAGQGKTTLLTHFVRDVPSGTLLLESGCDPLTTPSPLAPLHEVATRIDLSAHDLTAADRGALFAAVLEAVRAAGPCVWIIEDLHWADGATIDLIRYIGRRIDRTSTLLVLSSRSDELGSDDRVRVVLGDLARSTAIERIDLKPMSIEAVRVLCGTSNAERIHAVTAGNAFFVSEIAAGLDDEVPDSVRDAVLARVARRGDGVRRIVEAVSIAPRSMRFDVAAEMTDAGDDLLGQAATGGLLEADDDGLRFRHELARQAVERSIAVPTRRALHLRLLDLLVAAGTVDQGRLAHHAVRSGDAGRIVEHCPTAAREAAARHAFVEASELISASLRHRQLLSAAQTVDDLALYVDWMCRANRAEQVDDAADDLLDVADRSGDAALRSRARLAVARQRYAAGDSQGARSLVDLAIVDARRSGDEHLLVAALVRRAQYAMLARDASAASDLVGQALGVVSEPDDVLQARALNCLGCVEIGMGGDVDHGMHLLRQSLDIGERIGDADTISLAFVNLGTGAGEVRRYDESIEWLERAIGFSQARDADFTTLYVRAWRDRVRFERGEWGLVGGAMDPEFDVEAHMNATLTRSGALGRLGVRRGDPGAADALRDLVDRGGAADLQHLWPPLCGLAEAEWLAGRAAAGRELLRGPVEQALGTDSPWAQGELGWWYWRCGGEAITDGRDRTPFDQHVRGDWQGAAERWAAIGCPYEEALALADGPTDSRLRALAIFDRLEAAPAAAWLRQVLRDDGVTSIPRGPRPSTAVHPAGLTKRQSEVLALVADGLTNADIAERLFVSAKTVEHHLSAIFVKLGVSNRRDAVELAAHWPDPADR